MQINSLFSKRKYNKAMLLAIWKLEKLYLNMPRMLASFPTWAGVQITSYYTCCICNQNELDDNIIQICDCKYHWLSKISHGISNVGFHCRIFYIKVFSHFHCVCNSMTWTWASTVHCQGTLIQFCILKLIFAVVIYWKN